jgi:hypothetical protein
LDGEGFCLRVIRWLLFDGFFPPATWGFAVFAVFAALIVFVGGGRWVVFRVSAFFAVATLG